jgi:hypothetical protein
VIDQDDAPGPVEVRGGYDTDHDGHPDTRPLPSPGHPPPDPGGPPPSPGHPLPGYGDPPPDPGDPPPGYGDPLLVVDTDRDGLADLLLRIGPGGGITRHPLGPPDPLPDGPLVLDRPDRGWLDTLW